MLAWYQSPGSKHHRGDNVTHTALMLNGEVVTPVERGKRVVMDQTRLDPLNLCVGCQSKPYVLHLRWALDILYSQEEDVRVGIDRAGSE